MTTAYQRTLRAVCFDREPSDADVASLGAEPWRWLTYRRMVRARLYETIDHGFERLASLLGEARFHAIVDRFFAERGPRSPYLRDVPGELCAFLEAWLPSAPERTDLPPFTLDLARFEWAELDTAYTADEARADDVVELDMNLPAVLTPARRLLRVEHTVHRLDPGGDPSAVVPEPTWLCLYRDPASHDVRTLELTPITGLLLEEIGRSERSLADVVRAVAEREGATIDVGWVEAFSGVLAEFLERGLLLGSRARGGDEKGEVGG